MVKPFKGEFRLTQKFGENPEVYKRFDLAGHDGVDWALPNGTPVLAPITGTVTEVREDPPGYGKYVQIQNIDFGVVLAHFQRWEVGEGEQVFEGEMVGYSNNTGFSTGPHLHFGLFTKPRQRNNGYNGYVDPLPYLQEVEEINKLKEEIKVLEHRISELEKDEEMKRKRIDDLNKEVDETKAAAAHANSKYLEMMSAYDDLSAEKQLAERSFKALEKKLSTTELEVEKQRELVEKRDLKIKELRKKGGEGMTIGDLLILIWKKISPIKLDG